MPGFWLLPSVMVPLDAPRSQRALITVDCVVPEELLMLLMMRLRPVPGMRES